MLALAAVFTAAATDRPVSVGLVTALHPGAHSRDPTERVLGVGRRPTVVGAGLAAAVRLRERIAVVGEAGLDQPLAGRADADLRWNRSGPTARLATRFRVSALTGTVGRTAPVPFALDVAAGFGAVHTRDDIAYLRAPDDPRAQRTARQWHPSLSWSTGPRVALAPRWSTDLRIRGTHWVETLAGVNLEQRAFVDVALGVAYRP